MSEFAAMRQEIASLRAEIRQLQRARFVAVELETPDGLRVACGPLEDFDDTYTITLDALVIMDCDGTEQTVPHQGKVTIRVRKATDEEIDDAITIMDEDRGSLQ